MLHCKTPRQGLLRVKPGRGRTRQLTPQKPPKADEITTLPRSSVTSSEFGNRENRCRIRLPASGFWLSVVVRLPIQVDAVPPWPALANTPCPHRGRDGKVLAGRSRLPVRRESLARPRWQWATSGRIPRAAPSANACR